MKKSIFFSIFSGYIIISVLLISIILLFSFKSIRYFYIESNIEFLEKNASILKEHILYYNIFNNNLQEINRFIKDAAKRIQARITLTDEYGTVLADSKKNYKNMQNHLDRNEIKNALEGKVSKITRYSYTLKKNMVYVAIPIIENNKIIGAIRLSYYMNDINKFLNRLRLKFLFIASIMIVIALIIAWIFARKISIPIKSLSEISKNIAHGNYLNKNKKILIKTNDEISELAYNFNYMTENVESLIKNLSNQKEELRQIISSVNAGIVVCYKNLSILIYNKIFEKMIKENYLELENEYLKNKNFFEIMKDKKGNIELINIINDTLKTKKNNTKEIIIDKKTYILTVASILSNENIVMIFHDITDLKKSEIIKKEFVQNVTHELKTPLTSIKAFLETMEDEKEYNKKYISIIQNNIDRMVNIINDLLTLSEIENHKMKLDIEKINIKEMLDNIIELFEKKASGKNIFLKMKLEIDEVGVFLNGDKFRLEQVFINILDNAIKYTEKGEIIIYIENEKNYINVSIKDTGFGILEEHLDRIFERFYVVDKSRSKKLGGTGLGLSIVKHIVLLHKGTIKVESKIGVGSTFAIKLPRSLL